MEFTKVQYFETTYDIYTNCLNEIVRKLSKLCYEKCYGKLTGRRREQPNKCAAHLP